MTIILIVVGALFCFVLVPIIGILAAIAIPNFLRFQCKSKEAEAKTELRGLFTAEKSFYAEYDTYTTDLVALHWAPDGRPRYVYGFARPGPGTRLAIDDYDESRADTTKSAVTAQGFSTEQMRDSGGAALTAADLPQDTTAEKERFLAGAVGDPSPDSTRTLDVWEIDDNRILTHVSNDCGGGD
ncbi:MAG TPA: hypothetical protein VMV18_03355 [bacterium]|nr:hypothetical protein [bacterium]